MLPLWEKWPHKKKLFGIEIKNKLKTKMKRMIMRRNAAVVMIDDDVVMLFLE